MSPPELISDFFRKLDENDRSLLATACMYQLSETMLPIRSGEDGQTWIDQFLSSAAHQHQQFGKVIQLLGILDFELSPFDISRRQARAQHMIDGPHEGPEQNFIIEAGRHMLTVIPRLERLSARWQELRQNELDQAALWIYRDGIEYKT